jgi:hypothetical protein
MEEGDERHESPGRSRWQEQQESKKDREDEDKKIKIRNHLDEKLSVADISEVICWWWVTKTKQISSPARFTIHVR